MLIAKTGSLKGFGLAKRTPSQRVHVYNSKAGWLQIELGRTLDGSSRAGGKKTLMCSLIAMFRPFRTYKLHRVSSCKKYLVSCAGTQRQGLSSNHDSIELGFYRIRACYPVTQTEHINTYCLVLHTRPLQST